MTAQPFAVISHLLVSWYSAHCRELPWRETKDPYKIWISEVILQQTRVEQGREYYTRFVEALPTVEALAHAPEDVVLRLWQGLGYYSRARNLHRAAQIIVQEHGGIFPSDFASIRSLPGIGDYTAGAISSFAYELPYPAVDGNVLRVLSRLIACDLPIDSSLGKKTLTEVASQLLHGVQPSLLNQALIELGALVCTPRNPQCCSCPIAEQCALSALPQVTQYPKKGKQTAVRERFLYYVAARSEQGAWLLHKRGNKDIWRGLYEFPLLESSVALTPKEQREQIAAQWAAEWSTEWIAAAPFSLKHRLSHQLLYVTVIPAVIHPKDRLPEGYQLVPDEVFEEYALPVPLLRYWSEIGD